MNTPKTTIISKVLSLVAIAVIPILAGCASSRTTAGLYQPGLVAVPYPLVKPVTVYQPTIHYYGYGMGAIQAGLMNRLR